jgi:hypothetical protein
MLPYDHFLNFCKTPFLRDPFPLLEPDICVTMFTAISLGKGLSVGPKVKRKVIKFILGNIFYCRERKKKALLTGRKRVQL